LQGYLTNSDSEADIYYGCEFDNTVDANINADTNVTGFPFSISATVRNNDTGVGYYAAISEATNNYFAIAGSTSAGFYIVRRNTTLFTDNSSFGLTQDQWYDFEVIFTSATTATVIVNGVAEILTGLDSVSFSGPMTDGDLWIGQFRSSLGESPNFEIKNVVVKQGDTIVNDLPLYKDALDRSSSCNHGTLSATGVSFLNNPASEIAALNPDIASTETLSAQTNKKLILLGSKI